MSRLDKFEEILDGAGEKPAEEQKKWSNTYSALNEDTIHGCFVYRNEEHVLKISYKIHGPPNGMNQLVHNLLFAATFEGRIEAILSSKKNPDMLEAMVDSQSDENFEKKKLFPYVSLLEELYQQSYDEDEAFKPYWGSIQNGIKKIIDKLMHGRNDPCPCGSGKKFKNCCGAKLIDFSGTKLIDFISSIPEPVTPPSPPVPPSSSSPPGKKPRKSLLQIIKDWLSGSALLAGSIFMGADWHGTKNYLANKDPKYPQFESDMDADEPGAKDYLINKDPKYQKPKKDEQTNEGEDT